jgi:membrane protein implicated in regulation of membrane protease activity
VQAPVVLVNRGCASAGCLVALMPLLALLGFVWVVGLVLDAIFPGGTSWWVQAAVAVIGLNLVLRLLARRARRRHATAQREGGPPGVIDV